MSDKNVGISFLRIICSFGVVLCHFYYAVGLLAFFMKLSVPCFMVISFYFFEGKYYQNDFLPKRIKRLLIPHLFWSCIYFIVFSFIEKEILWNDLFMGMSTATVLNTSAWFVIVCVLLTLLFFSVRKYNSVMIGGGGFL